MLIDTHCHIQFNHYNDDRDDVIAQARRNHVSMLIVGCDADSSEQAIRCAEIIGEGVWAAVGQHPNDTRDSFDEKQFASLAASSSKVVAIGETGLDWYRLPEGIDPQQEKERQKKLFLKHCTLSRETAKPIIIHCRDAHEDLLELLKRDYGPWKEGEMERGVLHCFTGTLDCARAYLELGFLISFTGIITFARQYDDCVRELPLEKILIETDAPFLTPVPFRGKRNAPFYVEYIAQKMAELRTIPFEEVCRTTTENARRLFAL